MAARIDPSQHFSVASTDEAQALGAEVERIQLSGALGEARLRRLFDYLAEKSLAGQSPKEIAIAMDVFGKNPEFDVSQDALVRVYIHKLRKALDDFYSSNNQSSTRLHIPRGEYRLKVRLGASAVVPVKAASKDRRIWMAGAAAMLAMAILMGGAVAWLRAPRSDLGRVRASPIWSAVLKDDRPIVIVVGDYYLIGESDDSMGVKRLIREYSVNSKSDLDRYLQEHPELADRYMDVGLRYLPISTAFALRDVMAVLEPENRRISVAKMSDIEPSTLKNADIVYIGYLSGMGMLQDLVFAGSRFSVGDSYDEVFDKRTKLSYVSEFGTDIMGPPQPTGKEKTYRDYGIFEKVRGPGGNTIVVISGTRDAGVMQTADLFTSAQKLEEFKQKSDASSSIEALLEVNAVNGVSLNGKLLVQSSRGAM